MNQFISLQIKKAIELKQDIYSDDLLIQEIIMVSQKAVETLNNGNKILLAGNGGSAADAQHLAGELVSKFYFDRPALPGIALNTDTSILTAIGNDYGYENIFSRQVQGIGNSGDMFIGISTSGNSENIIKALEVSKAKNIVTVGLTGKSGGQMVPLCDFIIRVPSDEIPRIQEGHIMIGHIICSIIEKSIYGSGF